MEDTYRYTSAAHCNIPGATLHKVLGHRYMHSHTHLMEPAVLNSGIPSLGTMNRYWLDIEVGS